ncbi:phytoene desaturase family protein [Balneolales bacterium ANBcel1]|nr:phytoene desaturase family protein [Balneolales bacterium ANBcel1]
MKIVVIGAGLGGLSAAAILAADGHEVDVFEQNDLIGGKMQEVRADGFRFDAGPSTLNMPFLLNEVFAACGKTPETYLEWFPVEPLCRYRFADGVFFDNYRDAERNRDELLRVAPEDVDAWEKFMSYSADLYRRSSGSIIFNPLQGLRDLQIRDLPGMLNIDSFATVASRVDDFFSSPRLRQLFKQFTVSNGASAYRAPATMNIIPYEELRLGGNYIGGGMYRLASALHDLARDCGANVYTGMPVDLIVPDPSRKKSISGVMINGSLIEFDAVVAGSDATDTYLNLLPENALPGLKRRKISRTEPSSSGFVVMLGINRTYEDLVHHNVFFSDDHEGELQAIYENGELADEPTVYLVNTSHTDPDDAPPGCSNLMLFVNAPYTRNGQPWPEWKETYTDHIIHTLEKRGLCGLRESILVRRTITPEDFERIYHLHRGSIYGPGMNSKAAALSRPRNKSPWFRNLYLCGGSTHPGGGIPMVLQSALNVGLLVKRSEG